MSQPDCSFIIIIITIYPSTARVVRAPDDFTTSFLRFPLFSTALWDLANSRTGTGQTVLCSTITTHQI